MSVVLSQATKSRRFEMLRSVSGAPFSRKVETGKEDVGVAGDFVEEEVLKM